MFNHPRKKRSAIANASKARPSPATSATSETPPHPPTNTFNFRLRTARELRVAIIALADPEFNPSGLGRIDVDETKGFEITAINSENGDAGHLLIKPSDFKNSRFLCRKPTEAKIVSLTDIAHNFNEKDDGSYELTIFHVDGSDKITFMLTDTLSASKSDCVGARKFYADFLNNRPEILMFPSTDCFCKGALDATDLELMTGSLPDIVSCTIKDDSATIIKQSEGEIFEKLLKLGKEDPRESRYAWFQWSYDELLLTLLLLTATSDLYIVREPPNKIILRFTLAKVPLGILELIVEAKFICPKD